MYDDSLYYVSSIFYNHIMYDDSLYYVSSICYYDNLMKDPLDTVLFHCLNYLNEEHLYNLFN